MSRPDVVLRVGLRVATEVSRDILRMDECVSALGEQLAGSRQPTSTGQAAFSTLHCVRGTSHFYNTLQTKQRTEPRLTTVKAPFPHKNATSNPSSLNTALQSSSLPSPSIRLHSASAALQLSFSTLDSPQSLSPCRHACLSASVVATVAARNHGHARVDRTAVNWRSAGVLAEEDEDATRAPSWMIWLRACWIFCERQPRRKAAW